MLIHAPHLLPHTILWKMGGILNPLLICCLGCVGVYSCRIEIQIDCRMYLSISPGCQNNCEWKRTLNISERHCHSYTSPVVSPNSYNTARGIVGRKCVTPLFGFLACSIFRAAMIGRLTRSKTSARQAQMKCQQVELFFLRFSFLCVPMNYNSGAGA